MTMAGVACAAVWGVTAQLSAQTKPTTPSGTTTSPRTGSLYDRVGGLAGIAVLTDDFVNKLVGEQMGMRSGMDSRMSTTGTGSYGMGTTSGTSGYGTSGTTGSTSGSGTGTGTSRTGTGMGTTGTTGMTGGSSMDTSDNMGRTGSTAGTGMTGTTGMRSTPRPGSTMGTGSSGMGMSGAAGMDYSSGVNMSLLKYHVISELCESAGGPCRFTGAENEANFGHLMVTNDNWTAAMAALRSDLDAHGVTGADRDKLVTAVEKMKSHIVTGGTGR